MIVVLLISGVAIFLYFEVFKADDPIVITADGNVEGTGKIQRLGDLYKLTGDIKTSHQGSGITILRDNITIDGNGFSITNNAGVAVGIKLNGRIGVTVKNLQVENFTEGILITNCTKIAIYNCSITRCGCGISLGLVYTSKALTISHNNITENHQGIQMVGTYDSLFTNNYVAINSPGINMMGSHNNTITQNLFYGNTQGAIRTSGATNNTIYRNNFINNSASGIQVSNPWLVMYTTEHNVWDDGFEGNYWNDFKERYPNATETDGNRVWDTSYFINERNIDRYPTVNPFSFEVGQREQGQSLDWIIVLAIIIVLVCSVSVLV